MSGISKGEGKGTGDGSGVPVPEHDSWNWSDKYIQQLRKPLIKEPTKELKIKVGRLALRFLLTGKKPSNFHAKHIFSHIIGYLPWLKKGTPDESLDAEYFDYPFRSMMGEVDLDIPDGLELPELIKEFQEMHTAYTNVKFQKSDFTSINEAELSLEDSVKWVKRYYVWINIAMEYSQRDWLAVLPSYTESTHFQTKYGTQFESEYFTDYCNAHSFLLSVAHFYLVMLRAVGQPVNSVKKYILQGPVIRNQTNLLLHIIPYSSSSVICDSFFRLNPLNSGTLQILHVMNNGRQRDFFKVLMFHIIDRYIKENWYCSEDPIPYIYDKSQEFSMESLKTHPSVQRTEFHKYLTRYLNAGCLRHLLFSGNQLFRIWNLVKQHFSHKKCSDILKAINFEEQNDLVNRSFFEFESETMMYLYKSPLSNTGTFLKLPTMHFMFCRIYDPKFYSDFNGAKVAKLCYRLIEIFSLQNLAFKMPVLLPSYTPTEEDAIFIKKGQQFIKEQFIKEQSTDFPFFSFPF